MTSRSTPHRSLARKALAWALLVVLSAGLSFALESGGIPAALLVGALLSGIVVGVSIGGMAVAAPLFNSGQAVVGCLIAASLSPDILSSFASDWPLFVGGVLLTVAASSYLGWLISRWGVLPGTVGVWGSAPGAATAMVLMAGAFGADERLVAFMQYLRVIMVSLGAALIARLWVGSVGGDAEPTAWFAFPDLFGLALVVGVASAGAVLGRLAHLPSPSFLGAFILAGIVHIGFDVEFSFPPLLLAASYVIVGWTIGLKFRAQTLRDAARALPQIVAAIVALMGFCGAIGWLLVVLVDVDPLTAYLATSPGGMETIAIIAAAAGTVDITFVMTMQALRFLFVLAFGPAIARAIARRIGPGPT